MTPDEEFRGTAFAGCVLWGMFMCSLLALLIWVVTL